MSCEVLSLSLPFEVKRESERESERERVILRVIFRVLRVISRGVLLNTLAPAKYLQGGEVRESRESRESEREIKSSERDVYLKECEILKIREREKEGYFSPAKYLEGR